MERLPQKLVNVRVRDMGELEDAAAVWAAVDEETRRLDGSGRILVRPSGTEPLVRVMAEAPTQDDVDARLRAHRRPSSRSTWPSAPAHASRSREAGRSTSTSRESGRRSDQHRCGEWASMTADRRCGHPTAT